MSGAGRGDRAEQTALDLLRRAGLELVARNFRCPMGELDLVMREGDALVFVEVRYRRRADWGSAAESISPTKQARLVRTASSFLSQHPQWDEAPCRFDAVCFDGDLDAADWRRDILHADQ